MRKFAYVAIYASFPVLLIGIILPSLLYIMNNNISEKINEGFFWIAICIYFLSLSIIFSFTILLLRYVDKIDNLDKEIEKNQNERSKYILLRESYEKLIAQKTNE